MKIFVINICDERWKRYSENASFTRWRGVVGKDLDLDYVIKNYSLMWNAKETHKKNVAGCAESHLNLLKYIWMNKIDNVLVIEDDTEVDFERLKILEKQKEFTYAGGHFQGATLKKKAHTGFLFEGMNTITPHTFTIAGGYGYYIPHHQIACDIYHDIIMRNKRRGIDCEYRRLQKKGMIKKFVYPALVKLYLPVAKKGFTCETSNFKLNNDMKYYGLS